MTSRLRAMPVLRRPALIPERIKNIVFFNYYHIGDVVMSKGIVQSIIAQNPQYRYSYLIPAGNSLLEDISGLQIYNFGAYRLPFELQKDANYVILNDSTLAINLWIGAKGPKGTLPSRSIECHFEKMYANMQVRLSQLPLKLSLQSVLPTTLIPSFNSAWLSAKLPLKFLAWRETNIQPAILYHNYQPRSNQLFRIQSHEDVITTLAARFPTIQWLVAVHSLDLVKKNIPNIIDCATVFDCLQTKTCENLLQLLAISAHCIYQVHFDIGASFTFVNAYLADSACTTLYASSFPDFFYFHRLSENFPDGCFTQKVVPIVLDAAFAETLGNKIDVLRTATES